MSGTFGIGRSGTALVAASTAASIRLEVATAVRLEVDRATVGFRLNRDATLVLNSTAGTSQLSLGTGIVSVTSTAAGIGINTTGADVDQAVVVRAGGTTVAAPIRVAQGSASLVVTGLRAKVSDFVAIEGDFGFRASASGLVAASANASARLTAGTGARVGLVGGVMAFRITPTGKVALQATGGAVEVYLGPSLGSITATGVGVRINTTGTGVNESIQVGVGSASVTAPIRVDKGVTTLVVTGLRATLSGAVTITGDFGMKLSGTTLVAASANASAMVTAGSVLRAGVAGAVLAFRVSPNGSLALQSTGGNAVLDLGAGFVSVTAAESGITFNNTGVAVSQKVSIRVGQSSVLAPLQVNPGVLSLWIQGLEARVAGYATLSGDFGIRASGTSLVAVSANASALLQVGDTVRIGQQQAVVALRVMSDGTVVLQATGGAAVVDLGGVFVSVPVTGVGMAFNGTGVEVHERISVGLDGRTISAPLNVAKATTAATVTGLVARLSDSVTLRGDFGMRVSDAGLVAASANASAQLTAGGAVRVGLSGGVVGFRVKADGTVALQVTGGTAEVGLGSGFASVTASGVGIGFNTTGVDVDETLTVSVGGLGVSAPVKVAQGTTAVAVTGLVARVSDFVTLRGDFGMKVVGTGLVAVSANASAQVMAGEAIRVGLRGGVVGFRVKADGTVALKATGGTVELSLGSGFARATATGVGVAFNTTGEDVDETLTVSVGAVEVSVPLTVARNTTAVAVTGFVAQVSDFATLEGDFGMEVSAGGLVAASPNAMARLVVGDAIRVGLSDGVVGFRVKADGTVALKATGGTVELSLGSGFASATATGVGVAFNTTGEDVDETLTVSVGGVEVSVPLKVARNTTAVAVTGFVAQVSDFATLAGDFGLEVSAGGLVAVSPNGSARLVVGDAIRVGLSDGVVGF
ncbi:MAG: beta strand repeat-containing protein, partial [Verrucomicrobiota bacterium]